MIVGITGNRLKRRTEDGGILSRTISLFIDAERICHVGKEEIESAIGEGYFY
jgi:hypothetical protein